MSSDSWTLIPEGWKPLQSGLLADAKEKALEALQGDGLHPVQDRLACFYDTEGGYAGASFAQLQPVDPMDITASDILATTLLSVRIRARATRRILQDGATRDILLRKLRQLPDTELARAGVSELTAMAELYEEVKRALSADTVKNPNPWVTASKLCARKRPDLFAVRDRLVCAHLGLTRFRNYQVDWQVFRGLIQDQEIIAAIDAMSASTQAAAAGRHLRMDQSRLRLLDAAIWTYAKWRR
jgi:Family of unknown function (DUF6308)